MKLKWIFTLIIIFPVFNLTAQYFDFEAIWTEGISKMKSGDYLQGLESMNEILVEFPDNTTVLHNRSICLRYLGDLEGNCEDLLRIKALKPLRRSGYTDLFCDEEYRLALLKKQYYRKTKIYPELSYRPKYTMADTLRGALRLERNCYDVYFYNLTVRILPLKKAIRGTNEIWFKGVQESKIMQVDLFDNYTINHVQLEGKELKFHRDHQAVFIELPEAIVPGRDYKLTIEYAGKPEVAPRPPWDGGFVWSRDKRMNRWAGVACEQFGASSWWPNKDHLTEKPDSMAINIEVPKKYNAISNGVLRKVVPVGKGFSRYEWFVDYPINNYNVTFYMGKYTEFTDTLFYPEENLVMRYHVLPFHYEKAREHFKQARDVVTFYNEAFGPFPFWENNFRMVESPYEGMEHQTAIAYGNAFDNNKKSVEKLSNRFDYIIVHEAAHEWWGNAVTAGDMADIWLHEGFATYSEILFVEHMLGSNAALDLVQNNMFSIYNVWPLVQNRDVNENSFASNDVYTKGAILLHCLRATMNDDTLFKKMLHDFNMEFRFRISASIDFINYVNKYTGNDYTALFNKFLYDTRIPVLTYKYEREGIDLILKYKWTGVEDSFKMPFSIETIGGKTTFRLVGTTEEQEIILENTVSFSFFNMMKPTANCPQNGLTYFWTHCTNRSF